MKQIYLCGSTKDVANVLENVEQVDAVVGATDTIALAAYKYYSDKRCYETTSNIWFWW